MENLYSRNRIDDVREHILAAGDRLTDGMNVRADGLTIAQAGRVYVHLVRAQSYLMKTIDSIIREH